MAESERYTYRVIWEKHDQEHVGMCEEFPSLSCVSKTPLEAFNGIMSLVDAALKDMIKNEERIPEPLHCPNIQPRLWQCEAFTLDLEYVGVVIGNTIYVTGCDTKLPLQSEDVLSLLAAWKAYRDDCPW